MSQKSGSASEVNNNDDFYAAAWRPWAYPKGGGVGGKRTRI